jgi:membrane protein DedA with SNARE-associated domain
MTFSERLLSYFEGLPDMLIYLVLGLSAFVENIFPPLPGDMITVLGAFLVGMGQVEFAGVFISTTVGSLLGFLTLFALGRYLGRRFFFDNDFWFLKAGDIAKAEGWFRRYGYVVIAFNRFLPFIRSAVALAGGIAGLRLLPVTLLALASCMVWNCLWIFMGYSLGNHWETVEKGISEIMKKYNHVLLCVLAIAVLAVLLRKWLRKKK